jgi:pimeloyl-ACP methyl ester carboxylesterase
VKRWAKVALATGAAVAYERWMDGRNERRDREPLRGPEGEPLPPSVVRFSDGARVSLVDVGPREPADKARSPVVLVPGADGVKEGFRFQVPEFSRRRRVVVPDLREEFPPDATFDRLVLDLHEILEARDVGPALLLGQSLGGPICMQFALTFPEQVRGLVLSNTLARVSYEHVGLNRAALVPLASASVRYLPGPLARIAARGWSKAETWVFDDSPGAEKIIEYVMGWGPRTVSRRTSAARVALFDGRDLRPRLPEIRAPALVVKGPRDAYCPPEWSREIAGAIPRGRYVEIPGTGHCSHVSMPGRFNSVVLDWLAGLEG